MRLRFRDCIFDSDTRELLRASQSVAVSPKAFALLDMLIERRPRAVSKAEIHSGLWQDVHVSEANLGNLVVELRAALGDNAREPRIIRTVARFGYAFAARATTDRSGGGEIVSGVYYRLVWGRREISLEPGDNLIGRDPQAVVWIDDESVSRRHARISIDDEGASIQDLGSKNGTTVGDKRIRALVRLSHRDVVKVGPASLTLRILKRTASTRSTIKEHRSR